jgi:hypothetical protein
MWITRHDPQANLVARGGEGRGRPRQAALYCGLATGKPGVTAARRIYVGAGSYWFVHVRAGSDRFEELGFSGRNGGH